MKMKKQDYLKLMEEQRFSQTGNLFQKVIITAKRAKSLYELDEASKAAFGHKPTFQAILETNQGKIRVICDSSDPEETSDTDK